MRWMEFRAMHPDAWVIVEVIAVRERNLEQIALVELCRDAESTYRRYRELRRACPDRELCFLHTTWDSEVEERWSFSRELGATVVTL